MNHNRPVWAEVDLNAIKHNIKEIRRITSPEAKIMAVVKADGYGHGAYQVAQVVLDNGADRLAVAILNEALDLREKGIDVPILILGYTPEEQADLIVKKDITQTVFNFSLAKELSRAAVEQKKKAKIHIKIDTGMGRVGLLPEEAVAVIKEILELPNLEVEGMFTHFAVADEKDKSYTNEQFAKFMQVVKELEQVGIRLPLYHVANSAAIIDLPQMHFNMVRPGIILYGLYPSDEVLKENISLKPALTLKAKIAHLKTVPAGTSVSYGRKYITSKERVIATLPLGYADGYTRLLFGKGDALVHGQRAPIVGRVCMDQCMIDVTHIPDVKLGDEAVLIGSQGEDCISMEEMGRKIGTINYEVACMIGKRVPRIYKE